MNSISPLEELRAESERLQRYFANDQQALLEGITDKVIPLVNSVVSDEFMPLKEQHIVGGDGDSALVIHYTSVNTVIKMFWDYMKGRASFLRLYDTFHFNDPDEGKYLISKLDLINHPKLKDLMDKTDSPCAYEASFIIPENSEQTNAADVRDNLVFWRTYGREGAGCSIMTSVPAARLFKVRYGVVEEDALLIADKVEEVLTSRKSIIMEAIKPIMGLSFDSIKRVLNKALNLALSEEVESIFYLYKSRYYDYEKEARIIRTVPSIKAAGDEIFFEDNLGVREIRHYYNDAGLPVSKVFASGSVITLGPCVPYKENMAYYLEYLKGKSGLTGPCIVQSDVSYRSSS